jgi:hypothetical protein
LPRLRLVAGVFVFAIFFDAVGRFAVDGFFAAVTVLAVRDELRGELAAEVFVDRPTVLLDELGRVDRELVPPVEVFDRADVVLRDEDALERPPFDELLLDEPPRDEPLDLLREDEPLPVRAEPPVVLRDEALRPPVPVLFLAVDPPRLAVLELRPPVELFAAELFFAVDELPVERLRLVAAAPFLPAALFLAAVLLFDAVEREPPVDDLFVPVVDFLAPVDFVVPPEEDRELVPDDLRDEPPADDRDELELFFELPPLLLEPEDEREPDDFLVVAMRIIPPVFLYIPA